MKFWMLFMHLDTYKCIILVKFVSSSNVLMYWITTIFKFYEAL